MSAFTRSKSGLLAKPFFQKEYNYFVYTEGKKESSIDPIFWSQLFRLINPNMKIKFESLGSKPEVLALAQEENFNTSNIILCLDSDLDRFYGTINQHTKILYTYGYSVENDIFCLPVSVSNTVNALHGVHLDLDILDDGLESIFSNFNFNTKWFNIALQKISASGKLVDSSHVDSTIIVRPNINTTICRKTQRELINKFKNNAPKLEENKNFDPNQDHCYEPIRSIRGHSFYKYFSHKLVEFVNSHTQLKSLDTKILKSLLTLSIQVDENNAAFRFHQNQITLAMS